MTARNNYGKNSRTDTIIDTTEPLSAASKKENKIDLELVALEASCWAAGAGALVAMFTAAGGSL